MGKELYQKKIEELFRKSPVVCFSSISRIINKKEYAKQLVRNLLLRNKIKKLSKGFYSIHDNPELSVYCFNPAYLGLQDALSYHNLWEQETIPIIVTTRKVRQGLRKILGVNVLVRKIDKKYFFGFDYIEQNGLYFPYSDVEKTVIDLIHFKEKVPDDIGKNIDKKRLYSYLKKYPAGTRKRALNIFRRN
jgi:predicted transcriptional regulator of viral defense system